MNKRRLTSVFFRCTPVLLIVFLASFGAAGSEEEGKASGINRSGDKILTSAAFFINGVSVKISNNLKSRDLITRANLNLETISVGDHFLVSGPLFDDLEKRGLDASKLTRVPSAILNQYLAQRPKSQESFDIVSTTAELIYADVSDSISETYFSLVKNSSFIQIKRADWVALIFPDRTMSYFDQGFIYEDVIEVIGFSLQQNLAARVWRAHRRSLHYYKKLESNKELLIC